MAQLCRADVQTYCFGLAASMGAFLLGAGAKGKRYSMPNARIMIHQPLGGASGQAVDIEIQVRQNSCPASTCQILLLSIADSAAAMSNLLHEGQAVRLHTEMCR